MAGWEQLSKGKSSPLHKKQKQTIFTKRNPFTEELLNGKLHFLCNGQFTIELWHSYLLKAIRAFFFFKIRISNVVGRRTDHVSKYFFSYYCNLVLG